MARFIRFALAFIKNAPRFARCRTLHNFPTGFSSKARMCTGSEMRLATDDRKKTKDGEGTILRISKVSE